MNIYLEKKEDKGSLEVVDAEIDCFKCNGKGIVHLDNSKHTEDDDMNKKCVTGCSTCKTCDGKGKLKCLQKVLAKKNDFDELEITKPGPYSIIPCSECYKEDNKYGNGWKHYDGMMSSNHHGQEYHKCIACSTCKTCKGTAIQDKTEEFKDKQQEIEDSKWWL